MVSPSTHYIGDSETPERFDIYTPKDTNSPLTDTSATVSPTTTTSTTDTHHSEPLYIPPHSYTLQEVSQHNTQSDCWVALNGMVLDLTEFLAEHPGGINPILCFAGKDCSEEFATIHDSHVIEKYVRKAVIGRLDRGLSAYEIAVLGGQKQRDNEVTTVTPVQLLCQTQSHSQKLNQIQSQSEIMALVTSESNMEYDYDHRRMDNGDVKKNEGENINKVQGNATASAVSRNNNGVMNFLRGIVRKVCC